MTNLLFPYNLEAQELCDRGRYAMINPIEERINVRKNPYSLSYRKHVFINLAFAMYKVHQAYELGYIDEEEKVQIFSYWKNYGGKVIKQHHEGRVAQNAAKSALKRAGLVQKGDQVIVKIIKKK